MGLAFVLEVCAKPRLHMKSKHQEKAKSLQSKSLLDSSYLETTPLHNSGQIALKTQLAGDREVWSSHSSHSDCSCWVTQQLWNSCATKNKIWWLLPQGDCISRQGSRKHPCLLPRSSWHCHLFSLPLGMCLPYQTIHFGHTPQLLFFLTWSPFILA